MLSALALAHYSVSYARAWAADSINARVRLTAQNDRLLEEWALLREEIRIKDAGMTRIVPQRRPHYRPHERMAILELRAARGWSLKQTPDTFLVTSATIASSMKPVDEQGVASSTRVVTAKRPNHVCHVDLTPVAASVGFWLAWLPFSLPQCWPFCWWVAVAIDHYSRCVMGLATLMNPPTSLSVQHVLEHAMDNAGVNPKYVVCDKGKQFWCDAFMLWCDHKDIKPRFGAIGQYGSIAIVERFILSLKNECTRLILVPFRGDVFHDELTLFVHWYNQNRPHSGLKGNTPHEVYHELSPASQHPRFEPRVSWTHTAPCAAPHAPIAADSGAHIRFDVRYHSGRKHLPIVALRLAA